MTTKPFTLWELRPIKRLYPQIDLRGLRDSVNRMCYWEWIGFKKPVHPDRLGYWAWRGGGLNYTEDKPKK
jgi:hypothetical protein